MGKLGEAVVEVSADPKKLDNTLAKVERKLSEIAARPVELTKVSAGADRVGGALGAVKAGLAGAAIGVGVAAIDQAGKALLDCALKASDLGESLSKTRTTFGKDAGKIEGFADEMADKFGLVKRESIDAATSIGLIGKASGMGGGDAAALGVEMGKLAGDMTSFHNLVGDEALVALRSALVGEAEPMRRFGVLLSEDAVKAEALRLGLARTTGELSEQAKVRARISLIKNAPAMQPVIGDLDRTIDSPRNQIRKLQGDIENFKTKLGESFVGPLTEAIGVARDLGETLHDALGTEPIEAAGDALKRFLATARATHAAEKDLGKAFGEAHPGAVGLIGDALTKAALGPAAGGARAGAGGESPEEMRRQADAYKADRAKDDAARKQRQGAVSSADRQKRIDNLLASRQADDDAGRQEKAAAMKAAADPKVLAGALGGSLKTAGAGLAGLLSGARREARGLAPKGKPGTPAEEARDRRRERAGLSDAGRGQYAPATGLLGSIAGGLGQGAGNLLKAVTAPPKEAPRLGNAQVLSGADAAANLNLSEAFNAERDKQLAAQEKANDQLEKIHEGIQDLVKKTGGGAALIFGKK